MYTTSILHVNYMNTPTAWIHCSIQSSTLSSTQSSKLSSTLSFTLSYILNSTLYSTRSSTLGNGLCWLTTILQSYLNRRKCRV